MCVKFLTKFYQRLEEKAVDKSDTEVVEAQLMKFCKESRDDKENRFVSYNFTSKLIIRKGFLYLVLLHRWFGYFGY